MPKAPEKQQKPRPRKVVPPSKAGPASPGPGKARPGPARSRTPAASREASKEPPPEERTEPAIEGPPRSGTVAIIGRPNVGKSTLLNAALEMPLAIVSPTPQTTRDSLLGVVRHGNAEIGFLDTPGIFQGSTALDRVMVRAAEDAAAGADAVVFVVAIPNEVAKIKEALRPHRGDLALLAQLPASTKVVLAVNKIDLLRDKARLLPLLAALGEVRSFEAIVPISAHRVSGISRVLDEVAKLLPEGAHRFGADDVTDRPSRFFAREYVREQVLLATHEEVPHAVAVTIDEWIEAAEKRATRVSATIHVERQGQKKILIGTGGEMLTRIGSRARARLGELLGGPVHLELFVRVTPDWRAKAGKLADMGYGVGAGDQPPKTMIEAEASRGDPLAGPARGARDAREEEERS